MKIAVFTRYFPTVSQTFVIRQCTALLDRGHEVTIFARPPPSAEPVQDEVRRYGLQQRTVNWRRPGSLRGLAAAASPRWPGLFAEEPGLPLDLWERPLAAFAAGQLPRFDAVLAHFGPQGLLADWLRRLGVLQGPIATVFHGFDVSGFVDRNGRDVYRGLFERGALALPVSEHWAARLRDLGCPAAKVRVLRMGVRLQALPFRPRFRDPGQPLRLLGIGRLVEKKGFRVALEAVAQHRGRLGDFSFEIIGDGPERPRLEAQSERLGLRDVVRFRGAQPGTVVQDAMRDAHLLLAPSHTAKSGDQEGIPVVLMEAMALGLPVISTRHSGIPELVPAPQLVPEQDVAALGRALEELARRPEDWGEIGRRQRATVEAHFEADALDAQLESLLREMSSSSGR